MGIVTNNHMQSCIDACNKCAQACLECFNACLNEPDLNARKNCVKMLVECAMMCQMSAATMSMASQQNIVRCVLKSVINVLKNALCLKMIIARSVQILAVCVQMNAEKWLVHWFNH